jgi:hypothetical protein
MHFMDTTLGAWGHSVSLQSALVSIGIAVRALTGLGRVLRFLLIEEEMPMRKHSSAAPRYEPVVTDLWRPAAEPLPPDALKGAAGIVYGLIAGSLIWAIGVVVALLLW